MPAPDRYFILNIPVDDVDLGGVLTVVAGWLDQPDGILHHIVTVNPEFAVAARRDPRFARILKQSDLATADGVGLLYAARLLNVPVRTRVTGVQIVEQLMACNHPNLRVFLLGAGEGIAGEAAARFQERHPNLQICGYFSGDSDPGGFEEIDRRLSAAKPTVLLVAFGHPRQDIWIWANRARLAEHGILVAAGVGGVFDYVSGRVPLAPIWIRRAGLEWLYRLLRQPWRWRRQLALPVFVALVMREWVRQKLDRDGNGRTQLS